jgi:YlmC/YmxH family sporulation protein
MSVKFTDLQCKEVICVSNGQRLGFVSDAEVDVPEGLIRSITVPGPCRIFGVLGRRDDYIIPWKCIRKIGPDIILVDVRPEECCFPRIKPSLPF